MLILFAERFAGLYQTNSRPDAPLHADSFCRKVCNGIVTFATDEDFRFMLILFAERFAGTTRSSRWLCFPLHADSFCRKVCDSTMLQTLGLIPLHADSFCRKVCNQQLHKISSNPDRLMLILFAERFAPGRKGRKR